MFDKQKYIEIEKVYRHPDYENFITLENDIALIKLQESLKFSESVQPACLGTQDQELYEGTLKVEIKKKLWETLN